MPMQGVNHALAALYDGRDLRTLPLQPGLIRNLIGEGILHPYVQQFNPTVPGTPRLLADRIVNYRTVLMKHARTHIPPWRGRGYFLIQGDQVTPKIANWHEALDVNAAEAVYERNGESVTVRLEHVIED